MQLPDAVIHHPFEIPLGPIPLTGFGLAVLAAFVIAQIISQRELTRRGHRDYAESIPDLIFASVLGTLLGGKLYYILVITHNWRDFFTRAGFVFWGGFIGAVAMNWIFVKRRKLNFVRFADVAGVAIAAGYAVGRTGCWAVGDDYGRPWSSKFAVAFPYFDTYAKAGANVLTIHQEAAPHLQRQLSRIRELGCAAGVALNPSTPVATLEDVATDVDLVLVMSVNPGFGGQRFIPRTLEKLRQARALLRGAGNAGAALEVDGGIARDTIAQCWSAGANAFVAGNSIFAAPDPKAEIGALRNLCAEHV